MQYPNYKFIDTAIGAVSHRNNVMDITQFRNFQGKTDAYKSVFRFDESYLKYRQKTGSVKGYKGKCYCDYFPVDIDHKELGKAYTATKHAIEILAMDFDYEAHYIFFSGAKGFHILIPSICFGIFEPSQELPGILKKISAEMFPEIGDTTIYEINRLFRLMNTVHSKTGLYKIPLTWQDFQKGLDHILTLAKESQEPAFFPLSDNVVNEQFKELYQKFKNGAVNSQITIPQNAGSLYQMFDGVGEGQRDITGTKIAGVLKSKGMELNLTYEILAGWNLRNTPPLDDEQLQKIVNSVYSYDENGIEQTIKPIWAGYDEYLDYIKSEKKVNIGIPEIDQKIRGIRPGQIMTLLGYTGNFKTAVLQAIGNHYHSYTKEPILFFQMEMPFIEIFERQMQMQMKLSGEEVERMFKDGSWEDTIDYFKNECKNYYIVDRSGLTFADIEKYVTIAEQKIYKQKTGLILIDFVQLMSGTGSTNTEVTDKLAKQCKQTMKNLNIPVILASQVTGVDDPTTPLKLGDTRDSKTINQLSDYVLGIWTNAENDNQIISLLKNRKGGLCRVEREINRRTLCFGESYEIELLR